MRKLFMLAAVASISSGHAIAQVGVFDHCNAYLQYGAQSISRELTALHETAYNFNLYCRLDASEMQDSEVTKASGSIPGIGSGAGSRSVSRMRSALTSWCDEKRSSGELTERIQSEAIEASKVGQEAWNNCQNAARNQVNIRLVKGSDDPAFLHFEIDSKLDAPIHLTSVHQRNYSCVVSHFDRAADKEVSLNATEDIGNGLQRVNIPQIEISSENVQVTCTRNPAPEPAEGDPTKLLFERGEVAINTTVTTFAMSAPEVVDTYYVTPPGAIMAFVGVGDAEQGQDADCPKGWAHYQPAYGRFLRGIDYSNSNLDPVGQRAPGSIQEDSVQIHAHDMANVMGTGHRPTDANQGFAIGSTVWPVTTTGSIHQGTDTARPGPESRPKNVAVTYCRRVSR